MAYDTVGLTRALGYGSAHVAGVSMGGMIAQTMAAHHPGATRSVASISSTTGAPHVGRPALSTWWISVRQRPPRTRAEATARAVKMFGHIGRRGYDFDALRVSGSTALAWGRDPTTAGTQRQFAPISASGDRTAELHDIDVPTLVIHGDRDPMVHPSGGPATAAAIPGARLHTIRGLGHDLPAEACPLLAALINDHIISVGRLETASEGKEKS
jgi:pimeloyl-ACP methyl ester carboxylesterase